MKMKLIPSRYRLLTGVLALVVSMGALAAAPAPALASGWTCDEGCVDWSADCGGYCVKTVLCCSNNDTGAYECTSFFNQCPSGRNISE